MQTHVKQKSTKKKWCAPNTDSNQHAHPLGLLLPIKHPTKTLIRLQGYASWSASLLGACDFLSFVAQMNKHIPFQSVISRWLVFPLTLSTLRQQNRQPHWNIHSKKLSLVTRLLLPYANNKGADQPANPRSLISTFVVRCLDSIIPLVSISKTSSL